MRPRSPVRLRPPASATQSRLESDSPSATPAPVGTTRLPIGAVIRPPFREWEAPARLAPHRPLPLQRPGPYSHPAELPHKPSTIPRRTRAFAPPAKQNPVAGERPQGSAATGSPQKTPVPLGANPSSARRASPAYRATQRRAGSRQPLP